MTGLERVEARIDLGAIERNCARLVEAIGPGVGLCAVVKANGYGHGASEVAGAATRGGASLLAVATANEALELRADGYLGRLLVLGALTGGEIRKLHAVDAEIVAWTREVAEAGPRVHVKLDTGMGRLGTKDPRVARELCSLPNSVGLMTHFATADEADRSYFEQQLGRFEEVARRFPDHLHHCANSAATLASPRSHMGMVRCGVAIYGLDPFQSDPFDRGLEPALELHSRIASVRRLKTGETVGYGRRWSAPGPTWVGTLPVGYGDGLQRGESASREVLVGGRRRPVVGLISMDNLAVDLGLDADAEIGDPVTLIGPQGSERILAEEVARRTGTINYEVTCSLSSRVPRTYVNSPG